MNLAEWINVFLREMPLPIYGLPRTLTLYIYLIVGVYLDRLWRPYYRDFLQRWARISLWTVLWIIPTDLQWWGLSWLCWWSYPEWVVLQPVQNWIFEIVALSIAVIGCRQLVKEKMLHFDRWTIMALCLNMGFVLFMLAISTSPFDFAMIPDESGSYPLWQILRNYLPSRVVIFILWLAWVRPWGLKKK